jgi:nitrogen fixation protein
VALYWGIPDADSFFVAIEVLSGSSRDVLQTYVPEPPLGEIQVRLEQPQHFSGSVLLPAGLELERVTLRGAGGTRRVTVDGDGNFSDRTSASGPFYLEGVALSAEGRRVERVIRGTLDDTNLLDFR